MLEAIVTNLAVGVVWVFVGVVASKVADRQAPIMAFFAMASGLAAVSLWIFWVRWPVVLAGNIEQTGNLLLTMVLAGGLLATAQILTIKAMQRGHKAIAWAMSQSAMAVSFLAAVLIWHDPIPWTGWLGLCFVMAAIFLLTVARHRDTLTAGYDWLWLGMVLTLLLALGAAQVLLGLPSRWEGWQDSGHLRVPIALSTIAVVHGCMAVARRIKPDGGVVRLAVVWAVLAVLGYIGTFRGLDLLQPHGLTGIFFPVGIGVCIFGFSLYSKWRLGEPYSRLGVTGLTILVLGIGLLAIG